MEELTHWKRPWCWERLKAGGEGDDRGWDGWMASWIQWTWVWVNSGTWWWTRRPGVLQSMGSQRVGHNWDWTDAWEDMEQNSSSHSLLLEDSLAVSYKIKHILPQDPAITFLSIYPKLLKNLIHTKDCTYMDITVLYIITQTWKTIKMSFSRWMDTVLHHQ